MVGRAVAWLLGALWSLVSWVGRLLAPVGRAARGAWSRWSAGRMEVQADNARRARALCWAVGAVVAVLSGCLVFLQVISPDRYLAKGEGQRRLVTPMLGLRGSILDRHGEAFSMSLPAKAVVVDPFYVTDPAGGARQLAPLLGMEAATVEDILSTPDTRFSYLARQLEPELASKVDALGLPGLSIVDESRRFTTGGDLAQSVVGRMDSVGENPQFGLEKLYNDSLSGDNGTRTVERGSDGHTIVGTEQISDRPDSGSDVTLSLDRNLQFLAEQVLGEQLVKLQASSGTVIVGRPATGEMLAVANMVTTADGGYRPAKLNVAVRTYEPGSVMKIVTMAGAYEEGLAEPGEQLLVEPSIRLYDRVIRDSHSHPTELMSATRILAESSNVGTIKLAQRLGRQKILSYLDRFRFGKMTDLGLLKEQTGYFRREWSGTDIGSIPIGQSITATPVQVWSAFNTIANRGVYVAPRLVDAWTDPRGRRVTAPQPANERVVSEATAIKVTTGLQDVIEEGTGKQWAIPGYSIAAKTGTSYQSWGDGSGYLNAAGQRRYAASFAGFFPASNPQISIMVMIDNPKTDVYGSTAAGPVFDRLAKESMRRYGIAGDALRIPGAAPVRSQPARATTTTSTTTIPAPPAVPVVAAPVVGLPVLPPRSDGSVPLADPLTDDDVFRPDALPPDALPAEPPPTMTPAVGPSPSGRRTG